MEKYKIPDAAYRRFKPFITGFWLIQSIFLFGLSSLAAKLILPEQETMELYYFIQYFLQWGVWILFSLYLFKKSVISYDPSLIWRLPWFLRHVVVFCAVVALSFSVEYIYRQLIFNAGWGPPLTPDELAAVYLLQTGTFLMKYFFIVGFSQAVCYLYFLKDKEVQKERMQKEHSRLQYQFLAMQIKPHFIFNAHHTIHSLIEDGENKKASAMLVKLSTLLRNIIHYSETDTITLNEEIANLQNYTQLQEIRFGKQITIRFAIDPEAGSTVVPALSLQPLVENCYQHAFDDRFSGSIHITATVNKDKVIIQVKDSGKGFVPGTERKESYGLRNISDRITHLYNGAGTMEIEGIKDVGTTVTITIPASIYQSKKNNDHAITADLVHHRG